MYDIKGTLVRRLLRYLKLKFGKLMLVCTIPQHGIAKSGGGREEFEF